MENDNIYEKYAEISGTNLSHDKLKKFLEVAYNLRRAFNEGKEISPEELAESKVFLAMLLEYLINHRDGLFIDIALLQFIEEVLGIQHKKEKEETREQKEEKRLKEEYKKHRYRMAMYEIYKVINPNRLAGETELDNFINNLRTRGLHVARQYQRGGEVEKLFTPQEIENIASYKHVFQQLLQDMGAIGHGKGMDHS